ncbi:MAG: GH3 auxin-responsive promoter family protein, partial [Tistlia sp.]
AAGTRFGRDHGFGAIREVADYQARVPLRRYEDFWEEYWQQAFPRLAGATWPGPVPYVAKTSGTTSGTSKFIPVTRGTLMGNRRGVLDMMSFHLRARPDSRILGGKNFMLGGSTELERLAPGVRAGDMTGIAAREVPSWFRGFTYPPRSLELPADWERRLEVLGPLSLEQDIRTLAGTASWLLFFLQKLTAGQGRGVTGCYPNLELIVYGGVNFAPYRHQYEELLAGTEVDLREVYPASEGFLAVADRGVGEGLRLQVDGGIFYEFVPVEELEASAPRRFWLETVETGVNYAVVLSTAAGAWSYILGDTVRFVELAPPRILVTGRTSSSLSAFGEHLIEEEIVRAVTEAAETIGEEVADFSVGPVFPADEERRGHHLFVVEFARHRPDDSRLQAFTERLDARLAELNDDYREHRANDLQMKAPEVVAAAPGGFADWMRSRGKLGGQNKVPRVISDPDLLAALRDATANNRGTTT